MHESLKEERTFLEDENIFEVAIRSLFEVSIHFFDCDSLQKRDCEIRDASRCCWDAEGNAVKFPFEGRNDEPDCFRSSRTCRNDVHRSCTCTPEVLVWEIEQVLIIRVAMNRRHEPFLNTKGVLEHLRHRRQAVCR